MQVKICFMQSFCYYDLTFYFCVNPPNHNNLAPVNVAINLICHFLTKPY